MLKNMFPPTSGFDCSNLYSFFLLKIFFLKLDLLLGFVSLNPLFPIDNIIGLNIQSSFWLYKIPVSVKNLSEMA